MNATPTRSSTKRPLCIFPADDLIVPAESPPEARPVIVAYIDPGAGSMLIQALIASALAIPFFLRTQIRAVIDRVRRRDRD